jgi:uracil-DNA glycosylase
MLHQMIMKNGQSQPDFTSWSQLEFWNSGEWQKVEEDLDAFEERGVQITPERDALFRALHLVSFLETKVCIVGQDPYPNPKHATGVAFSIPVTCRDYPPTLQNIFREYSDVHGDLKYPYPKTGCLEPWCKQGVLLWNAYPCLPRIEEFTYLTVEILQRLSKQKIVFVSLGAVAQRMIQEHVTTDGNIILHYSHPSPLGFKKGFNPFFGSRLFSTINDKLCEMNEEPINWRLP